MAKRYHPDTDKGSEEEFKKVNEAYQVLSNKEVKEEYDQTREANERGETTKRQTHSESQRPHYDYYQQQSYHQQNEKQREKPLTQE